MIGVAALACSMSTVLSGGGEFAQAPSMLGGRSLLHAHNAYPEDGRWRDRIDRALATGQVPMVIEQDIAFAPRNQPGERTVVSHDDTLNGDEPSLQQYFFDRVRPIIERALTAGQKDRWPVLVLHLDFKTNEREHHRAVWDLLKKHQAWLTTAVADPDAMHVSPFKPGPLLVLTENGAGQEKDFSEWAAGGSHLLFGSIPPPAIRSSDDAAERARIIHGAAPHELVPTAATSYRRWVNFSWGAIEEGGPSAAGEWTPEDERRLTAVVGYAHQQGLFVRFYTLNGHTAAANRGWTASYNFGTLDAARARWSAAIRAKVDLIATDQYEDLASQLRSTAQQAEARAPLPPASRSPSTTPRSGMVPQH
jgi:hypothetical protein